MHGKMPPHRFEPHSWGISRFIIIFTANHSAIVATDKIVWKRPMTVENLLYCSKYFYKVQGREVSIFSAMKMQLSLMNRLLNV